MTEYQKNQIVLLSSKGFTYAKIAEKLDLSINTVKSFYQRNQKQSDLICKYCGKVFIQPKGTRKKLFCSDNCRMKWWNIHGCDCKHNAVGSSLRRMEIVIENIVHALAIFLLVSKVVLAMSKKEFKNEKLYQTTMHIARKMLKSGLISWEEYRQIDTIFTEKYHPTLGTLFADIDLL